MKTDNGLAIALFAVVIGGAVALAIANDIVSPACETAREASWGAQKPFIGCVEFWLERYQGLIGGALAFAGAVLTIGVMRWQTHWAVRRRRKVALMQAIAQLRPFRDECISLVSRSSAYDYGEDISKLVLPTLPFTRDPTLLVDLTEDEARRLFHFSIETDRISQRREDIGAYGDVWPLDYVAACAAWNAQGSFDLVNEFAVELNWVESVDPPVDDEYFANALALYPKIRKETYI